MPAALPSLAWHRASEFQMQGLGALSPAGIFMPLDTRFPVRRDPCSALPRGPPRRHLPLPSKHAIALFLAHLGFSYPRWNCPLSTLVQGPRVPSAAYPPIVHYCTKENPIASFVDESSTHPRFFVLSRPVAQWRRRERGHDVLTVPACFPSPVVQTTTLAY